MVRVVNWGRPKPSLQVSGIARPVPRGLVGSVCFSGWNLWVGNPALVSETPHFPLVRGFSSRNSPRERGASATG